MVPEPTNRGVERGLVGRDRAPLPRRHDLARVERETRRDAERAARRSAVLRAERAGGVLEEHDLLRHGGLQRLPLDRTPEQMHRHDRARSRRDRGGDGSDVQVEGVGVDVDQHRLRTAQLDGVRRRRERVGGDDHLVARPDLEREEGEMERGGPGRDGCRVRRADGLRDRGLELLDLRAHRELPGANDLRDRCELGVPDVRPREPDRLVIFPRRSGICDSRFRIATIPKRPHARPMPGRLIRPGSRGTTRSSARALRRGRPWPRSREARAPSRCSECGARRRCSGAAGRRPRPGSP